MILDAHAFASEMSVRDYECDMQGIVNNSVYQNYLE
jgi:acyl-CoA thioester hydrolase